MAVNNSAATYATNSPDTNAAVVDVDIKHSDNRTNNAPSGKARSVVIAGTVAADGTFTPGFSAGGGTGGGGGGPATIANGADVAQGNTADAAYTDATGAASGTIVSLLKGLFSAFKTVGSAFVSIASQSTAGENLGLSTFARVSIAGGGASNLGVFNYLYDPVANNQKFMRGDGLGSWSVSRGAAAMFTNQAAVTTSATQIVAARANRGSVKITNLGTTDIYLGPSGVTTTTGDLLVGTKGASVVIPAQSAVFAIGAAAGSVSIMEVA